MSTELALRRRLAQAPEGKAVYLVAEDAGEIVGHVFLKFYGSETDPDYPNLEDLYVREDRRGSGIGSALLARSETLLREKGYGRVGLSVNPDLNPRAKALYQRLGYKDTGRDPYLGGVYDGDEDWVIDMVKLL
jgi:[ribosomal protein S18]-alanine N-acetyltransferase